MTVSDQQLAEFISERTLVCIRRNLIDHRAIQAIPLAFSDELLLVQYIYDFHVDGQLILRRNDISETSCRATDQFQREILVANGLMDQVAFDFSADLASFPDLLNSQPADSIVILENEGLDESDFWIGRFVDSTTTTIRLHEFTGAANWLDELTSISVSDVSCCQMNSNYIQMYSQHFAINGEAKKQRSLGGS